MTSSTDSACGGGYERLPTGGVVERRRHGRDQVVGLLDLDVRLLRTQWSEPKGPDDQSRVIGYTHPATGRSVRKGLSPGRVRSGDWVWELPPATPLYQRHGKVWTGICAASPDADALTVYGATGWWLLDGHGWTYIHRGGGITCTGAVDLVVAVPPGLRDVELPAPVQEPTRIRSMFDQASLALMTRLERHVGAALVGAVYRAPLGWTPAPTVVYGGTARLQTLVGLAATHFGVGSDSPTDCLARGIGSTPAAIRAHLRAAKDCLYVGSDIDQCRGAKSIGTFVTEFIRIQFHTENTHRTAVGGPSRATVVLTAEVDELPAAAALRRMHTVPVNPRRLDIDVINDLNSPQNRLARVTVMASMRSWMAADLPAHRAWATDRARRITGERPAGRRRGEPLVALEVGWELAARFLVDVGAYTACDAERMLVAARQALARKPSRT